MKYFFFVLIAGAVIIAVFVLRPRPSEPSMTGEVTREEAAISQSEAGTPPGAEAKAPKSAPSLEDLFTKEFDGANLTLGRVLEEQPTYTRHFITYTGGGLTISGIMNVPKGDAPAGGFPVLILNHGYIDPAIYTNGRGLRREQDYLARQGFVVLHPDYRNHAQSSKSDQGEMENRLGYVEDVINAVFAVRRSDLPFLDGSRIGMLGHSMGGGITQAIVVSRPDLVRAAVLYAPVSMDYRDSYFRYMADDSERASRVAATFGTPEAAPERWDAISPKSYVDRITVPLLLFHGTQDQDVPIVWSEKTVALLEDEEKDVTYVTFPGEGHEFGPYWGEFMSRTAKFFRAHLDNGIDDVIE